MNQILNNSNHNGSSVLPMRSILKFFAFAIIILGIIFISVSSYSLFSNKAPKPDPINTAKANISFAKDR